MADPVVCLLACRSFKQFKCEYEADGSDVWRIVYKILTGNLASKSAFWGPTGIWRNRNKTDLKYNGALLCGLGSSRSG
jgi:hypothetical protein